MADQVDRPLIVDVPATIAVGRGTILALSATLPGEAASASYVTARLGAGVERGPVSDGRFFLPVAVTRAHIGTTERLTVVAHDAGSGRQWVLADRDVTFVEGARAATSDGGPARDAASIVICLATYEPNLAALARQLDSIRAQTRRDWVCLIRDDASSPDTVAAIARLVVGDERFVLIRGERNLGFYRNFEAALSSVPRAARYVALCDQDDVWYAHKLEASVARLEQSPRAQLVYSDMRLVAEDGRVLAPTFWTSRRNNHRSLATLLFVNTVTGAASVFRAGLLDAVLPFPAAVGRSFHDHWIACVAHLAGGIAFIDEPLHDYVQHGANVIGQSDFAHLSVAGATARHARNLAELLVKPWRVTANLRALRRLYAEDYRRLQLIAATLRLRFPDVAGASRRALTLFADDLQGALRLLTSEHAAVLARGDSTDMIEARLGLSWIVERLCRSLGVGLSDAG